MEFIPEDAPFPIQASLYGASKTYCEGLITSYCEGFGFTAVIGRWVQIIGERYLHGHVIDFVRKLLHDPTRMEVLGDGRQRKSGLYVQDLVAGIYTAMLANDDNPGPHIYNWGRAKPTPSMSQRPSSLSAWVFHQLLNTLDVSMAVGWAIIHSFSLTRPRFMNWDGSLL